MYYQWKPYVSAAARRRQAERTLAKLRKQGGQPTPVHIDGRVIAHTFWGSAWCDNLERYSDFSNRLPRGKTYVRNGSVIDLRISPGQVDALVSGSRIYEVRVEIARVTKPRWRALRKDCAGAVASVVELLQGRFSTGVMQRLCKPQEGMFPAPKEIKLACSCPDWAIMCKHVAAVLYGVGARLDEAPQLLFTLRQVDYAELVAGAGKELTLATGKPATDMVLEDTGLAELFGIELEAGSAGPAHDDAPHSKTATKRSKTPVAAKAASKSRRPGKPAAARAARARVAVPQRTAHKPTASAAKSRGKPGTRKSTAAKGRGKSGKAKTTASATKRAR
ncbi:MAG: SWIM zinc finger family protein [Gammaproteobacteria bacterium]|nr:SWIM zinc finger family protein [Gammaproteobacteria bacterium]